MDPISKKLTVTEAKAKFLELIGDIQNCHETVTITRNGHPAAIIMNPDDFEALIETLEILSDAKVMASLKKSAKQIRAGKLLSDDEVWG